MEIVDDSGRPDGDRAAALLRGSEEMGLLLLRCGTHGQIVRWLPPLIVTREHIDAALDSFSRALSGLQV